ncbi:hypothetical protein E1301_Tti023043 [Triplophysa tibetana]|uniref:Endonuclease/exonuclease/phosphatase domain-containing protein n=1 Tax=Triplophysa tibetana TaxID=1572043 RepID=A0A5A9NK30_9TELE|nr:hypothetical protein E1301_Tti023043 [Triplophysa tibetana]
MRPDSGSRVGFQSPSLRANPGTGIAAEPGIDAKGPCALRGGSQWGRRVLLKATCVRDQRCFSLDPLIQTLCIPRTKKKMTEKEDLAAGMNSMKIGSESEEGQSGSKNEVEEEQSESENEVEEEQSESEKEGEEKDLAGGKKKCSESKFYSIKDLITKEIFQEPNIIQQPIMYTGNLHSRSKGVAILVNKPHKCLKAYSEGGDFVWVYIEINGQKYTFVSVYYHKDERDLMSRIHQSFLIHEPKAWKESNLVIGGDFNTRLYPVDVNRPNFKKSQRKEEVKEFMKVRELIDVWRQKKEAEKQFTYSCKEHISRLDYVFMLKRDCECFRNCVIPYEDKYKISDHYPVVLTTQFK